MDSNSIEEVFMKLGYLYTIGLYKQMLEIKNLSNQLFLELEVDFDKLTNRIEKISSHLKQLKRNSKKIFEINYNLSPHEYIQNQYCVNELPKVEQKEFILQSSERFIKPLLQDSEPPPSLEAFSSLIPDYKNLDLEITDPTQFERQYKEEMLALLANFKRKLKKKMKKNRVKDKEAPINDLSAFALNAYIETVNPPLETLICPPPPGSTSNWRTFAGNISSTPIRKPLISPVTAPSLPKTPLASSFERLKQTTTSPTMKTQQSQENFNMSEPTPPPSFPSFLPPPPSPPPPPPISLLSSNKNPSPKLQSPPGAPTDHLALIRQGVKLRKTETNKKPKKIRVEETDPNSLSMAEILQTIAEIREAVADEESDSESSGGSGTSSDW
ncbi:hypothetical protein GPJ56_003990 [Histomonas meleagridis]|uniref:uncharacterized protein n=1 Tax=Histomonas meleagridis TaxID=135588 RepID=UPI0035596DA5|nr:hypothetical protein GPJ56_003990 [Histomonas meleagridis]KAH0798075.1 hypothetical protein GO595_009086 [Histomonas meleagridis]